MSESKVSEFRKKIFNFMVNKFSRGMALCFVMMFGRIGGVAGSNFIGAVINGYCGVIFIVAAFVLVGMYRDSSLCGC